ncbi:uncharacterized protein At4g19900 [Diospyros lotus]|uniref:uncharacterized protein At4g19900 n=1 Tax=Diospyros lotus TaxID=55363 RepID=UPI002258749E|nr:uncharacterized protein At4g19900 [Diospyros lotus]
METQKFHTSTNPSHFLHSLHTSTRSIFALLSSFLLLVLAYNGAAVFCLHVPFLAQISPGKAAGESRKSPSSSTPKTQLPTSQKSQNFLPDRVAGKPIKWSASSTKLSTQMYAIREDNPIVRKPLDISAFFSRKRRRKRKPAFAILRSDPRAALFSTRVKDFLSENRCKIRFFMTWISSVGSFGDRELFAVQSLFNSHPNGCLIIVSNSMDSRRGMAVLRPFLEKGFHVAAISPDFNYLFQHTAAEAWFDRLWRGNVRPGEVSLGQNLSNLLRLALLYKFGGVYIDTDVIVLKSLGQLRNAIGAQTIDLETGKWSRLNNAVMVFDKGHPLVLKFIDEFALTFNGNKWGYNGPYLVSRVVSRMRGELNPGFDFSVLHPMAFYPVDWSRIHGLFRGPRNSTHSKWLQGKLHHIRTQSYAVHLWNRQSKKLRIEEGSIISHIMSDCCVLCNSSASNL